MAEFLWTFAVQEGLKKVVTLAAGEIGLIWGFKNELSKMSERLRENEIFLCDINTRKLHSMATRQWVDKLQHLVHEVDDLLDELLYEDLRRKNETGKRKWVCNLVSFSNNYFIFRLKMARKMKTLTDLLDQHCGKASSLGLVRDESSQREMDLRQLRETVSNLDDFEIVAVGRDDEVSSIVKKVIDAHNSQGDMSIIPIVGMGGLGKTTLAKLIINHETIKAHFDKTVWVCVSEPFLINKILEAIIEALDDTFSGSHNKETLLLKLKKEMHGKKYFLVLDDVWNENSLMWNELKSCLMGINAEISIIVTTRSAKVAEIMETVPSHHLSKLSDDQCWSLFTRSANAKEITMNPKLEVVREELVTKIGGLPLVARVLGRAVQLQGDDYDRWVTILKSVARAPCQSHEGNFSLSILKLSVDRLPSSSLKQCFAYCSNFPKDFKFEKERLIQMWMAQGFIQPREEKDNKTMEDIGDEHFHILLSRCLFQDVVKDKRGRIQHYKMHDLVHDIACDVSSKNHKLQLNPVDLLDKKFWTNDRKQIARKLSTLICDDTTVNDEMEEGIRDKNVNFDCLRILILDSDKIVKYLLDSNSKLKHLRYLDISRCSIKKLPKSIVSLYNLQTLRIGPSIEYLPENLRQLVNLRHLKFEMGCLDKSKHMPPHLSQLIQLQTLSYFKVGLKNGRTIRELGTLKNLKGRLALLKLNNVKSKDEAKDAKLVEKENLRELLFDWTRGERVIVGEEESEEGLEVGVENNDLGLEMLRKDTKRFLRDCELLHAGEELEGVENNDLEVLEGLQPHKNLRSLVIQMFGGNRLPDNIFVDNLITISLRGCCNCEILPMFGQLANLEDLEIVGLDGVRRIGDKWYGNDSNQKTFFPKLKKFELWQMTNLEQWEEMTVAPNATTFPLLKSLIIGNCPKLLNIGDVFGYSVEDSVKHLTFLEIRECSKLTKLPNGLQLCDSIQILRINECSNLNLNLENKSMLSYLRIGPFKKGPEFGHFTNLKELEIRGRMEDLDLSFLVHLPSLIKLGLRDEGRIGTSLPQQLEYLIALQELWIYNFEGIEVLPECLGNLTSLQILYIQDCKNLKQLPSKEAIQRLTRLRYMCVYKCPQLLLGEGDRERAKVSHVPTILID